MTQMSTVVDAIKAANLRQKVKIMVGGAPVTDSFCKTIGADIYTPDAATAAEEAYKVCVRA
jgi:methanogenic corrinoid protein MtbC1